MVNHYPLNLNAGDDAFINATVSDINANVLLGYRFSESESFTIVDMLDNGFFNDGNSGDGVFGALIPNVSNVVQYYIYAENDSSGRFSPERAAYEYYTIESKISPKDLTINELMAVNSFVVSDSDGEYDDWIELYNNTSYKISTKDIYLSNDSQDKLKWLLPEVTINPDSYYIIWADDDVNQNGAHANFKLDKERDSLWMSYSDGSIIDSINFSNQHPAISYGRYPNGVGDFIEMMPTYESFNIESDEALLNDDIFIFPNPAVNSFDIKINFDEESIINIYTIDGRILMSDMHTLGIDVLKIDSSNFKSGVYFVSCEFRDVELVKKIIIKK